MLFGPEEWQFETINLYSVTLRNILSYGLWKFVELYCFIFIFMAALQKDKSNPEILIMFYLNLIGSSYNILILYSYLDHSEKLYQLLAGIRKGLPGQVSFFKSRQVAGSSIFIFGSTQEWNSSLKNGYIHINLLWNL